MGNAASVRLFKWEIMNFSALSRHQNGVDIVSGSFEAGGYIWALHLMTTKSEVGNSYLCLRLCLKTVPSELGIKAKYNIIIYDQRQEKHIKETGASDFTFASSNGRFHYMIPLETFNDVSSGYLMNDNSIFGVEILQVLHSPICKVVTKCLSLSEGIASRVSWTWKIESAQKLQRPHGRSEDFYAGDLKWYILLASEENTHLSVYLILDCMEAIRLNPAIYVEFMLCIKDQIKEKHRKEIFREVYSTEDTARGWPKLLPYEDLYNPTKGFLVNNTCHIEASVRVIGSVQSKETLISNAIDPRRELGKPDVTEISTVRMSVVRDGS